MDEIAALSTDAPVADELSSSGVVLPIRDRVRGLIATACDVDTATIADTGHLLAYGLDSVRAIDLLVSIEETFHVAIPEREAIKLKTVRDVIRCVEEKAR